MCSTHIWMTRHSMRTITALNRLDSDGSIGPKTVSTLIWTLDPGSSPTRIRLQEAWAFRTKAWVRNFLSPTNIYARYRPESNLYEAQFLRDLDSKLEPAHWIVPTIGLGPAQSGPDHAQQQGPLTSGNNGWSHDEFLPWWFLHFPVESEMETRKKVHRSILDHSSSYYFAIKHSYLSQRRRRCGGVGTIRVLV